MAESQSLRIVVVTPERAILDEAVDHVILPLYDGEMGVYSRHMPVVGKLGPGELRVVYGNTTKRFYLDGGFAQVRANVLTVLTDRAIPVDQLNVESAQKDLKAAESLPSTTAFEREIKARSAAKARAALRLAKPR